MSLSFLSFWPPLLPNYLMDFYRAKSKGNGDWREFEDSRLFCCLSLTSLFFLGLDHFQQRELKRGCLWLSYLWSGTLEKELEAKPKVRMLCWHILQHLKDMGERFVCNIYIYFFSFLFVAPKSPKMPNTNFLGPSNSWRQLFIKILEIFTQPQKRQA